MSGCGLPRSTSSPVITTSNKLLIPVRSRNGRADALTELVSVVFAAIRHAVFGEQFRINLIPPRFGIGKQTVEIKDYCAKNSMHGVLNLLPRVKLVSNKYAVNSTALPKEGAANRAYF